MVPRPLTHLTGRGYPVVTGVSPFVRIAIASEDFQSISTYGDQGGSCFIVTLQGHIPISVGRRERQAGGTSTADTWAGIDVLITRGAGEGLARCLADQGIRLACTSESDPARALTDFLAGLDAVSA